MRRRQNARMRNAFPDKILLLTSLLLASVAPLLGNGGASVEGVPKTGSASATDKARKTEVTIDSENLKIDLHSDVAGVEVHYVMHNTGPKVQQDFFFPIERWGNLPGEEVSAPPGLENYRITVDGKELSATEMRGPPVKEEEFVFVPLWEEKMPIIKAWKKSSIPFEKGQKRDVIIRYSSKYAETNESVSDDEHNSDATFAYSLSPAATWKGPIGHGKIELNVLHSEPEDVSIEKPKDRFKKVSDTHYEWEFENLKPSQADDIRIIAHSKYERYPTGYSEQDFAQRAYYVLRGNQYFLDHTDYDATASSTLGPQGKHSYDVINIKADPQREVASPWAEGVDGDGVGESITLHVKRALPLYAILIRPGYYDYDEKGPWQKNNRVAALEITLNDEHTFTENIPDEFLTDPYLIRIRDYAKPINKVKMVIKAVHHGTQFHDTCISLVQLRAALAQKPEVTGAR
jgi:hypothetical protein